MAQSNKESNVRGITPFRQNHTVDPPIPWEDSSDLFHLAIIAKENVFFENLLNPLKKHYPLPPTPDGKFDEKRIRTPNKNTDSEKYPRTKNDATTRKRHLSKPEQGNLME